MAGVDQEVLRKIERIANYRVIASTTPSEGRDTILMDLLSRAARILGVEPIYAVVDAKHPINHSLMQPVPICYASRRFFQLYICSSALVLMNETDEEHETMAYSLFLQTAAEYFAHSRQTAHSVTAYLLSWRNNKTRLVTRNDLDVLDREDRIGIFLHYFSILHEIGHSYTGVQRIGMFTSDSINEMILRRLERDPMWTSLDKSQQTHFLHRVYQSENHPLSADHVLDEVSSDLFALWMLATYFADRMRTDNPATDPFGPHEMMTNLFAAIDSIAFVERARNTTRMMTGMTSTDEFHDVVFQSMGIEVRLELALRSACRLLPTFADCNEDDLLLWQEQFAKSIGHRRAAVSKGVVKAVKSLLVDTPSIEELRYDASLVLTDGFNLETAPFLDQLICVDSDEIVLADALREMMQRNDDLTGV